MAIRMMMTENPGLLKKRRECLDFLRKHSVDVGLKSSASARPKFLLRIQTHESRSCGFRR